MAFYKNGKICILEKNKYDSCEIHAYKGQFMVSHIDTNIEDEDEYENLVVLSNIYANIIFKKCEYNRNVMNKLQDIEKNIMSNN